MKFLYLYSLGFLLLLIGCTNKNDFESNEHFDIDDLIGVYEIKVAENTTDSDNSWMYSKRQNRNLTLNLDSTYVDVNISFEAFDFVDYYGKWQIFGNKIKLTPIGQLRYENGQYFKDSLTHTHTHF